MRIRTKALLTKTTPTLILLSCLGSVGPSFAAEEIVAGKTLLAKGNVKAINPETNDSRSLKRRSKIMSVEHITTGENSKAQFSMSDGGLITLKENTEINVSHYVFDEETQQGSATLEVISGGLRSISGLIKKTGGDYQVKTPVGSIGIRGTHFAVEVSGDDVYFGVYSGNIDIELDNEQTLSLGVSEGFAFASVSQSGTITPFTKAPEILSLGYNTSQSESSDDAVDEDVPTENSNATPVTSVASTDVIPETTNDTSEASDSETSNTQVNSSEELVASDVYTDLVSEEIESVTEEIVDIEDIQTIAELISERTGTFNYAEITQSDVTSSVGNAGDLSLNLAVDFDNGTVPGGSLSLTDAQGEWFASYSGLINVDQLELNVNFASHANKRADGDITAVFSDGLDEITGEFNLQEVDDTSISTEGSFQIK
ncbi:FecR family protein [Pseudocolwellia sp. AS88]|uniref:FecR family protein n=1 Tax=Pseudocolwellia sp. AS88 TaxID=3063958 RepID=UPI0026EFCDF8|nr:FecR family protein [Pseudocolwellia sp. AS88]MDO7084510.1 FecR family protein [Pseudocolwellia sp. AS88]